MEYVDSLYDDSAEKYDSLLVEQRFKNPAIDLIAALSPATGSCHLDIGTGTGAALFPAMERVGPTGTVLGLDPSGDMLRIAQRKGASLLIEGKIPGISFLENTFDTISANFVLSHMDDYRVGLKEIFKVLKPAGAFGATTWAEGQQHYNAIWNEVTQQFINETTLKEISREQIPWEPWFEQINNIQLAFSEAGFEAVQVETKEYSVPMILTDYLACRYTLLSGKFIQKVLSPSTLLEFEQKMYQAFQQVCGDSISYVGRANVIIAKKR